MVFLRCFFSCLFVLMEFISVHHVMAEELPDVTIYNLYKDYAWVAIFAPISSSSQQIGKPIAYQAKKVLQKFFDNELTELLLKDADCTIKKKGALCSLGFDPIFASQDPMASDLLIQLVGSDVINVEFIYPSNRKKIKIRYKMTKLAAGWRIFDVLYEDGTSLRNLLSTRK